MTLVELRLPRKRQSERVATATPLLYDCIFKMPMDVKLGQM